MNPGPLQKLLDNLPQQGRLEWIGLRPQRGASILAVQTVRAEPGLGLEGDRFSGRIDSARQVTLIQQEHLPVIAACVGRDTVSPETLRRNLVISGINLLALKDKRFRIGEVLLEYSGACHPCSKMETALGPGGYNAVRGHGGITARVIRGGWMRLGDPVSHDGSAGDDEA